MATIVQILREFNCISTAVRLIIAAVFGGLIGMEREQHGRAAGPRTYILVTIGAALAMILDQYYAQMLETVYTGLNLRTDVARLGAQVISGVGFLGAGTILVTSRREVQGLTTAASLWTSACVGIAIGAGYYECIVTAFVLMVFAMRVLPYTEKRFVARSRVLRLYVEMDSVQNIGNILQGLRDLNVRVLEMDLDSGKDKGQKRPSAELTLYLPKDLPRTMAVSAVSGHAGVSFINMI